MRDAHCGLNFNDNEFDQFVKHGVNILKEMKVSHAALKEMV